MNNYFLFGPTVSCKADAKFNNDTIKKLWNKFSYNSSQLDFSEGQDNTFVVGDIEPPVLTDGKEFAIRVTENGLAVKGADYGGLMRGFIALIMQIKYNTLKDGKEELKIYCFNTESDYKLQNRMIHICVFPENDFYFIKKLVRFAGICQYTHVIFEFWGMVKYDCLKELAWENAFSKDEVRELINEARVFGMEPIPMFNMLGHATASRVISGKHVVLDQNPALSRLFTPDGWAWNIESEEVFELLKKIRFELYELFEGTEYFHIGCDEAYFFQFHDDARKTMPDYLKRLTDTIVNEGKKPMMWMDMVLEREKFSGEYAAFGNSGEAEKMLNAINPQTVMVDWQYDRKTAPIETSVYLKDKGKELIIAPWLNRQNYDACIDTATENNLFGIMLTTWHTLKDSMPSVLGCAEDLGAFTFWWSLKTRKWGEIQTETATLLRRISFEGNSYKDAGWVKNQILI